MVFFQYGKRNPDVLDAEILSPPDTIRWLEKQMLENRVRHGFCQPGDVLGSEEPCNTDINYLLTDANNPYASEYDTAASKGYKDPRLADVEDLRKRKEGTLFSEAKYMIDEPDPSAGGNTVTARGVACVARRRTILGYRRIATAVPKSTTYLSLGVSSVMRIGTTVLTILLLEATLRLGAWPAWLGRNDFGIPEDSNRCARVDDIPKPWCFIGDGLGLLR